MGFDWVKAIPAVLGIGGAGAAAGLGALSSRKQYERTLRLQQQQQQWQEMMSNTAISRQKNDLLNAGFNPILATMNGGASTPSGGMGNVTQADYGNPLEAVSTAYQAQQTKSNVEMQQAQSNLLNEQSTTESTQQRINIAKAIEQEGLNSFLNERQKKELNKLGAEIINLNTNTAWMRAKQSAIQSEIDLNSAQAMLNREATKTQAKANKYDEKHPYQYGASRILSGIGNVFSVRR